MIMMIVIMCGIGILLLVFSSPYPNDDELISILTKDRVGLENLVSMIKEDDGLQRVDDTWTNPADPSEVGVSKDRISRYRKLFTRYNVPRGFANYEDTDGGIWFFVSSQGIVGSGGSKGYAHFSKPPPSHQLVESLDQVDFRSETRLAVFRKTPFANWYLFREGS